MVFRLIRKFRIIFYIWQTKNTNSNMKHILTFLAAFLAFASGVRAQDGALSEKRSDSTLFDRTVVFSMEDTTVLGMDVYMPSDDAAAHRCVVFAYGGGYMTNNQRSMGTQRFCRRLADDGFVAIAIDYRLGLKDFVAKGGPLTMIKPTERSIKMAAEDMFKAVKCIIDNAEALKVCPDSIILCGSSAGAITALQADYELCNRTPMTAQMPEDFRFAGVISFAGAIFSHEGKCDYRVHDPAPTFFLHGTKDHLVDYKKIQVFQLGFFGSNELVKRFVKFGWPYKIMRFKDEGHSVAMRMLDNYDDVIWFIDNMVSGGRNYRIDETFHDVDRKLSEWDSMNSKKLYVK